MMLIETQDGVKLRPFTFKVKVVQATHFMLSLTLVTPWYQVGEVREVVVEGSTFSSTYTDYRTGWPIKKTDVVKVTQKLSF